ncbi:alpha-L-rhamnosidase C-terminal domain-containing protein [uncultured Draconibacterium sp.]|uniref:alpha-L-rhamnosidase-related protein n=1 Tax=uncultured Draconibacterium sp. TaxID=1573823 RepID=UPI003217180C
MKRNLQFLSIALLTITLIILEACVSSEYSEPPTGLTVECIREPQFTKIIDSQPEFSWIVPQNAVLQTAYQILVASSKDLIDNDKADIWDSGNVSSANSGNVEFGGESLAENTSYFWKVRITDKHNRQSAYSEVQQFTTGAFGDKISSSNFFRIENIKPRSFHRNEDASFFADFGKDAFGTLQIHCSSSSAKTLTIRLGEKLKDGAIDREPGGTIRFAELKMDVVPGVTDYQIELVPDERNTKSVAVALPDSFPVIMPFRYLEIDGAENLQADDVTQLAYFYYFNDNAGSFSSSDSILNQVWDLCKYSQKATSFAGYYVDGDRERIPYEADAYLNQLSHYSVDNEYSIARKTIEYFMDFPTWPTEWQLHVALLFYQDYMYTGNTELIEKYYEPLKYKTLMELEDEDGFISTKSPKLNGEVMAHLGFADTTQRVRDIVDWPQAGGWGAQGEDDGFVFRPINTVVNAMYFRNMEILTEFAELLGKTDEAADFKKRAAKVKKSINQKLYNKEKGYYADGIGTDHGSVHANMFPLAFGVVPEEYKKAVGDYIKTRGVACSVYGAQYLMEAVYEAGADNYALELMNATHDRSWYNMIKVGSTITMEAWDMKYKPNSDWNHAWGAAPANIIPRYMWGIQPKTPGFGEVSINPQMGNLTSSSLELPTLKGKIIADFKQINKNELVYSIELPANMSGEFISEYSNESIELEPGKNEIVLHPN